MLHNEIGPQMRQHLRPVFWRLTSATLYPGSQPVKGRCPVCKQHALRA